MHLFNIQPKPLMKLKLTLGCIDVTILGARSATRRFSNKRQLPPSLQLRLQSYLRELSDPSIARCALLAGVRHGIQSNKKFPVGAAVPKMIHQFGCGDFGAYRMKSHIALMNNSFNAGLVVRGTPIGQGVPNATNHCLLPSVARRIETLHIGRCREIVLPEKRSKGTTL
ncbi:hypothetical protein K0M31_013962 [Melipona bicolor]|uniref:Uncharacterized protein n=1 Tax=Melipona bicolor TaxID=60889 RepID=A0AA40G7K8_9HYME|nr:hypothetical protein K0M31_013962 [Melipona bicolor]